MTLFEVDLSRVPQPAIEVSKRQFYTALALQGFITTAEAEAAMAGNALPAALEIIVATIEDETEQFVARGKLLHATTYISTDPLVAPIAASQELSPQEVTQFFQGAAQL